MVVWNIHMDLTSFRPASFAASGTATSPRPRILGWLINFYIFGVIFHTKFPYRLSTSFKCRTSNKTTHFNQPKNVIIFGVDTPPLHSVCAGFTTPYMFVQLFEGIDQGLGMCFARWRYFGDLDEKMWWGLKLRAKEPENWCLEDYFPFGMAYFRGLSCFWKCIVDTLFHMKGYNTVCHWNLE